MVKVGDQQDVSILDIIYGNKHFEPKTYLMKLLMNTLH
jgi:hypothetical protein